MYTTFAAILGMEQKRCFRAGVDKFFCKKPDRKYFSLWAVWSLPQLLISAAKAPETRWQRIKNTHGCVPIQFYLQKRAGGQIWTAGHSLPTFFGDTVLKGLLSRFVTRSLLSFIYLRQSFSTKVP